MGAFDSVLTEQVPVSETVRDIVFTFEEGKELDVSLMLGYGSYEQIRAGVELNHQQCLWPRSSQSAQAGPVDEIDHRRLYLLGAGGIRGAY